MVSTYSSYQPVNDGKQLQKCARQTGQKKIKIKFSMACFYGLFYPYFRLNYIQNLQNVYFNYYKQDKKGNKTNVRFINVICLKV